MRPHVMLYRSWYWHSRSVCRFIYLSERLRYCGKAAKDHVV